MRLQPKNTAALARQIQITGLRAATFAPQKINSRMSQSVILEEARHFARGVLQHDSSGHDWWHVYRVTQLAGKIAAHEGADAFICELAALLHDIADEKLNESKEAGRAKVEQWLLASGIAPEISAHVLQIIGMMSYSGGGGAPMQTLEGKVVQDADRLDALGAIGIARTFAYSGWKGQLLHDPQMPPRRQMSQASYRTEKSTAINHFHEKLLLLKDRLNTVYARQLAEERHRYMEAFLEEFLAEWEGSR